MKNAIKEYLFLHAYDEKFEDICIVVATTEEEALRKVAAKQIKIESNFLEYVSDRAVNMSFAEAFFLQGIEEHTNFCENGDITTDKAEFIKRVRFYFGCKKELAEEFINYFYSDEEEDASSFSDELLIEIWLRDWQNYKIFDMDNIIKY